MTEPTPSEILSDPKFHAITDSNVKREILGHADKNFMGLSPDEQDEVINHSASQLNTKLVSSEAGGRNQQSLDLQAMANKAMQPPVGREMPKSYGESLSIAKNIGFKESPVVKGFRELAIPTALSMAGGAAGLLAGPAAPYAVPVLSGAGAALGSRINDIIAGERMPLKESFIDAAKQTALDTAFSGAGDYLGNVLFNKAAQKEIAGKRIGKLLKQSEELNVRPTPADITNSGTLGKVENIQRGLYGSGGQFEKADIANTEALIKQYKDALNKNIPEAQAVDISHLGNMIKKDVDSLVGRMGDIKGTLIKERRNKILKSLGSPLSYEDLGKQAVDVETRRSQAMKDWTMRLYNQVKSMVNNRIPQIKQNIDMSPVRDEAKSILNEIDNPHLESKYASEIKYLKKLVENSPENAARDFLKSNELLLKNYPNIIKFNTVDDLISNIKNNTGLMSKHPGLLKNLDEAIQPYKVSWDILEELRRGAREEVLKANEALTSKTPGMAGQIKQGEGQSARIYGRIKNALQDTQTQFAESLGGRVQKTFKAAKASSGKMKEIFNDKVFKAVSRDHPSTLIDNVLSGQAPTDAVKRALGNKAYDRIVKRGIVNKLMGVGVGEVFDPKQMDGMLKQYGDELLAKTFRPEELKQLHRIAKQGIDYANQKLSSPIIQAIADLEQSEGYSVASRAFHGKGEYFVGNMKQIYRAVNDETKQMMKRQLTIELFTGGQPTSAFKADTIASVTPELIAFSGNKFSKNLKRIMPVLPTFGYSEQDISLLRKIASVSTSLGGVERMAINPSKTARTWAGWSQGKAATLAFGSAIVSLASGNIPGAALTAAGGASLVATPYIIAKAYLSPTGRKLLTEGFKIRAGTPEATAWMTKVIGYSTMGQSDDTSNQPTENDNQQGGK